MTLRDELAIQRVYANRGKILTVAAVGLLAWNARLRERLAARPQIAEKVKEVRVEGPVRVVTVVKKEPSGACTITRTTDRGPVTTSREAERTETPITEPRPWRYAGVLVDPLVATKLVGLRGSITFWDHLEVGVAGRYAPRVYQGDVGIRW